MFNVRYDASSEYLFIVDEEQWSGGAVKLRSGVSTTTESHKNSKNERNLNFSTDRRRCSLMMLKCDKLLRHRLRIREKEPKV